MAESGAPWVAAPRLELLAEDFHDRQAGGVDTPARRSAVLVALLVAVAACTARLRERNLHGR